MTPSEYIAAAPEPTRAELTELHALIRAAAPTLATKVAGNMIVYGPYRDRHDRWREVEAWRVALAARKTGISLYVGKRCLRFARLAELDRGKLMQLLTSSAVGPCAPAYGDLG